MKSWIKCVAFDLDGVLADTKNLHFQSFQQALQEVSQVGVSQNWYDAHDGLTTLQRLRLLVADKKIRKDDVVKIYTAKSELTNKLIKSSVYPNTTVQTLISKLHFLHDVKICVVSNSRAEFVDVILKCLNIDRFIDYVCTGDNAKFAKPNPQMYLDCAHHFGISPQEMVVFEDSMVGVTAAHAACAHVVWVKNINDVTIDWVSARIKECELKNQNNQSLARDVYGIQNINVVMPMAGAGSRFSQAGYSVPKPFINVRGKPMFQMTIDSVGIPGTYTVCMQRSHLQMYSQRGKLPGIQNIVFVDHVTQGAACTVLLTDYIIDNDDPLFIVNSDQYIEWDWSGFMTEAVSQNVDGGIVTFEGSGTKWSYAKTNGYDNQVIDVAEKVQISNNATAGIYYWRRGSDFVRYAQQMIGKNIRVNNEFYVCPVFRQAIDDGKKIIIYPCKRMLGLGTPEDLLENEGKL